MSISSNDDSAREHDLADLTEIMLGSRRGGFRHKDKLSRTSSVGSSTATLSRANSTRATRINTMQPASATLQSTRRGEKYTGLCEDCGALKNISLADHLETKEHKAKVANKQHYCDFCNEVYITKNAAKHVDGQCVVAVLKLKNYCWICERMLKRKTYAEHCKESKTHSEKSQEYIEVGGFPVSKEQKACIVHRPKGPPDMVRFIPLANRIARMAPKWQITKDTTFASLKDKLKLKTGQLYMQAVRGSTVMLNALQTIIINIEGNTQPQNQQTPAAAGKSSKQQQMAYVQTIIGPPSVLVYHTQNLVTETEIRLITCEQFAQLDEDCKLVYRHHRKPVSGNTPTPKKRDTLPGTDEVVVMRQDSETEEAANASSGSMLMSKQDTSCSTAKSRYEAMIRESCVIPGGDASKDDEHEEAIEKAIQASFQIYELKVPTSSNVTVYIQLLASPSMRMDTTQAPGAVNVTTASGGAAAQKTELVVPNFFVYDGHTKCLTS